MKKNLFFILFGLIGCVLLNAQMLDQAILAGAVKISRDLPSGSKVALVQFNSTSDNMSAYVINEFNGAMIRNRRLTVVRPEQGQLQSIASNLNSAGGVSAESAQNIGQNLGVEYLVTGSLEPNGIEYTLLFDAIDTETATLQSHYTTSLNLRNDQRFPLIMGNVLQNITQGSQNKPTTTANNNNSQPAQPQATTNVSSASQEYPSLFFIGGGLSAQQSSIQNNNYGNYYFNYNNFRNSFFEFSPYLGYRFGRGAVGLSFLYQAGDNIENTWGVGIFGDYIFSVDRVSIVGRLSVQYNNGTASSSVYDPTYGYYYDDSVNMTTIRISITPMIEYRVFDHFALNASIGSIYFEHMSLNIPGGTGNIDNLGISFPTELTLGFCFFF